MEQGGGEGLRFSNYGNILISHHVVIYTGYRQSSQRGRSRETHPLPVVPEHVIPRCATSPHTLTATEVLHVHQRLTMYYTG